MPIKKIIDETTFCLKTTLNEHNQENRLVTKCWLSVVQIALS
jgi:hypothetical protein